VFKGGAGRVHSGRWAQRPTRGRPFLRFVTLLALILIVMSVGATRMEAVSVHGNPVDTLTVCVESVNSADGCSVAQAENALQAEVFGFTVGWNDIPGADKRFPIDLSLEEDCSPTPDVVIKSAAVPGAGIASYSSGVIKMDSNEQWTLENPTPAPKYSYEGVVMHELGHALGYGHSGDNRWNVQGDTDNSADDPTMVGLVGGLSEVLITPEKDDAARVPWSEDDDKGEWWTYSPGFEDGFRWWDSGDATISNIAYSGSDSAYLNAYHEVVKGQHLYDPWNADCDGVQSCTTLYSGMSNTPRPRFFVKYRDDGNTTGGIQIRSRLRYYDYDTTRSHKPYQGRSDWSMLVSHTVCNQSSGGVWKTCSYVVSSSYVNTLGPYKSYDENAVAIKMYFRSETSLGVRVDVAGIEGW